MDELKNLELIEELCRNLRNQQQQSEPAQHSLSTAGQLLCTLTVFSFVSNPQCSASHTVLIHSDFNRYRIPKKLPFYLNQFTRSTSHVGLKSHTLVQRGLRAHCTCYLPTTAIVQLSLTHSCCCTLI